MLEVGIISEDEPLELIEGELVVVSPQGPLHSHLAAVVGERLLLAYGSAFLVRAHSPVDASPLSLPEPDIAVVRKGRDYWRHLPTSADTVLVIELSLTSMLRDRRKASIYAKAGYATYWSLNVDARTLEVHDELSAKGVYRSVKHFTESDTVQLPELDAVVTVRDLLPDS